MLSSQSREPQNDRRSTFQLPESVDTGPAPLTGRPTRKPLLRKALTHGFVAFHLVGVLAFSFSASEPKAPFEKALRKRVGRYMFPLGLWQSWVMFAPNPAMANAYLEAEVTFRDGSRATWPFPRMDRMGYAERCRKERYRKWATERVNWMGGKPDPALAEAAAKFAARQVDRGPDNPPWAVELVRYWAPTPPPSRRAMLQYGLDPSDWERQPIFAGRFDEAGVLTRFGAVTTQPASQPAGEAAVGDDSGGSAK